MFLSPSLWYEVADGRPLLSLTCVAREALISVLTLLHVRATAPPLSPPSRPAQERETKEKTTKKTIRTSRRGRYSSIFSDAGSFLLFPLCGVPVSNSIADVVTADFSDSALTCLCSHVDFGRDYPTVRECVPINSMHKRSVSPPEERGRERGASEGGRDNLGGLEMLDWFSLTSRLLPFVLLSYRSSRRSVRPSKKSSPPP